MTITLELPPNLEERFRQEAQSKGVPLAELVQKYFVQMITAYLDELKSMQAAQKLSADEIDRAFEEAADLIPEGVRPLSDEAMSRDSIYTREDDWNR